MPISPIGAISVPTAASVRPPTSTGAAEATRATGIGGANPAESTGNLFTDSLEGASRSQAQADDLTQKAATGELTDLTAVMSAMTEAQLSTQLTVALRNKAVESFNEIMRMQI